MRSMRTDNPTARAWGYRESNAARDRQQFVSSPLNQQPIVNPPPPPVEDNSISAETTFEELLGSVREAGAILRARKHVAQRRALPKPVRAIRERTALSQSEFAHLIGVSVKTLQNWEQERRRPTGPAAALLSIIDHDPALAVKAIHRI